MKEVNLNQRVQEFKFTSEHILTKEQSEKMIKEKLERAERFLRFEKVQKERTLQR